MSGHRSKGWFGPRFDWGHWQEHRPGRCGDGGSSPVQTTTRSVNDGLAVTVAVAADSFGTDTFSSVTADIQVIDRGLVSYTFGSVTAIAAASGGIGFASTAGTVSMAGADLGTVNTHTVVDASGSAAVSTTDFVGIALKFDLPGLQQGVSYQDVTVVGDISQAIDGNLASYDASIYAEGDNTLADLQVSALALQEEFSTVALSATAAASSSVTYTQITGTKRGESLNGAETTDVVMAGRGDDKVDGRGGDDWLFGQDGEDRLTGGNGDDTLFGGDDDDRLVGGAGDDWLFGGDDEDRLEGEGGDDLLLGGDGRDVLRGGAGADVLHGGDDDDVLDGGADADVFMLGMAGGDDDDHYTGGLGADLYWIVDSFDRDVIYDFSLGQGDRFAIDGDMADAQVTMRRANGDADDLEITFRLDGDHSTLVLDEFFRVNTGFASMPKKGLFTPTQTTQLLDQLDGGTDLPHLQDAQTTLAFGDLLSLLG